MSATILCPLGPGLREVRALRRFGPPALDILGLPEARARTTADRVRAAIRNAGFTLPAGRVAAGLVAAEGAPPDVPGLDLGLALAVLLADPAHEHVRRPNLIAWGGLGLDGSAPACDAPDVADLPPGPWAGRFWRPTDHVPAPEEDAVLSIVDVDGLAQGWDVIVRLVEMERELEGVASPFPRTRA